MDYVDFVSDEDPHTEEELRAKVTHLRQMIINVSHFIKGMRSKQVMHDLKTLLTEGKEKRDQETEAIKKLLEDTVSALSENL